MAIKNSPSPTGLPQLNQLPQARQFLCDRSYHASCSSCDIFVIENSYYVNKTRVVVVPVARGTLGGGSL